MHGRRAARHEVGEDRLTACRRAAVAGRPARRAHLRGRTVEQRSRAPRRLERPARCSAFGAFTFAQNGAAAGDRPGANQRASSYGQAAYGDGAAASSMWEAGGHYRAVLYH
ncbi:hypothetical protein GQ55_7G126100 [Panicum hallii var. hallii]|uniref:Uncharacterized protein n=1 Tax=Panicum hallii var. hallii TaxID=1504633 RepID=A0A2T7CUF6_9POAL|nr:hypothetical protein GQ55_7G126100 [Panicum hallii var. hallii]